MKQHKDVGNKVDLSKYRIDTAKYDLNAANILFGPEEYRGANSM